MNDRTGLPSPAAGVAAALREASDEDIARECRWETFRASGPGGQKRNKTSSAVRVVHGPTGLSAIANESRSQSRNKAKALERLRHKLALHLREPADAAGWVVPAWLDELAGGRGRLGVPTGHARYLAVMGLVLDGLAAHGWSVSAAAEQLGLTTANLVRFLQQDEALLAEVNRQRAMAGLKVLGSRA